VPLCSTVIGGGAPSSFLDVTEGNSGHGRVRAGDWAGRDSAKATGQADGSGRERMPERPWDSREDHVSILTNQSAAFKLFYVSTRVGSSISGEVDAVSESVFTGVGMQSSQLFNYRISNSNSSSSSRSSIASGKYIIYFLI
jgi:hypothetical protein